LGGNSGSLVSLISQILFFGFTRLYQALPGLMSEWANALIGLMVVELINKEVTRVTRVASLYGCMANELIELMVN